MDGCGGVTIDDLQRSNLETCLVKVYIRAVTLLRIRWQHIE